jgi:hypothetical protein
VNSKAIGFFIYRLRSFTCPKFICFFHLWGSGCANWRHEHFNWLSEQSNEWHLVTRRNPLTGANAVPIRANRSFVDVVNRPCPHPCSSDHAMTSCSPLILNRQASTSPCPSHVLPTPSPPPQPNSPSSHSSAHSPPRTTLALMGCTRCLHPFHRRPDCKSLVRCRAC